MRFDPKDFRLVPRYVVRTSDPCESVFSKVIDCLDDHPEDGRKCVKLWESFFVCKQERVRGRGLSASHRGARAPHSPVPPCRRRCNCAWTGRSSAPCGGSSLAR